MFFYVDHEVRVRGDHALRPIRAIVKAALANLSAEFDAIDPADVGRPSILPERLLRALLLQVFYDFRSERQIMERLEYDLLFGRFVGLRVDDAGRIRRRLAKTATCLQATSRTRFSPPCWRIRGPARPDHAGG